MDKIITKVTKKTSTKTNKIVSNSTGWCSVLKDIENDIRVLKAHRGIVRRKIERGEPWLGNAAGTDANSIPA